MLAVGAASVAVRAEVQAERRFLVSKASISATAAPVGMAPEVVHDLAQLPFSGRSFSVYGGEAVRSIAEAYRSLPWVRRVRMVEVGFPSKLRFDVAVRRPAAGLRHRGEMLLIDRDGVVLPTRCYQPAEPSTLGLPVLVNGPFGRRVLEEGDRLLDVPVQHGLAVAHSLRAESFAKLFETDHVVEIDISNVDGRVDPRRSEVLVVSGRTVIEWGRSPIADGLKVPLEDKLKKLTLLLARGPRLNSLTRVRLQFDDLEWRALPHATE